MKISSLSALLSFILALFLLLPADLTAQITGNDNGDRRQFQTQQGSSTFDIDLSGGVGSFYYLDELGINLGLREGPLEEAIQRETYILGPGDLITIKFEGGIDGAMRGILVNPQGDIVLPNIGTISVEGLSIVEASELVGKAVEDVFTDSVVQISIDRPRLIKVHIVGDVPFPGVHLVTAQTRLDQALFLALFEVPPRPESPMQSPIPIMPHRYPADFLAASGFSLRNIHIDREDETELIADLISYFRVGDRSRNPMVRSGDVITVNRLQEFSPRVSVSGAVQNRMSFEYREDDTLDRMIRLVGGLTQDSKPDQIRIYRDQGRVVEEVEFEANRYMQLGPNDRVVVPYDRSVRANHMATVHGEAVHTGHFPIKDGETTVDELLAMAGGLSDHALPNGAYLVRTRPGRTGFGSSQAIDHQRLTRTSDQYLQGFEYLKKEGELDRNEVFIDLTDPEQIKSVRIFDADQLFIPRDDKTVFLLGQVNNPGYFPFIEGRDAYDYIQGAGGFTIAAEEERVFVIKAGSRTWKRPHETSVESGDIIMVDRVPYDDLASARAYEIQRAQLRNSNIQLIMTGLTTITGIITTYVAITR